MQIGRRRRSNFAGAPSGPPRRRRSLRRGRRDHRIRTRIAPCGPLCGLDGNESAAREFCQPRRGLSPGKRRPGGRDFPRENGDGSDRDFPREIGDRSGREAAIMLHAASCPGGDHVLFTCPPHRLGVFSLMVFESSPAAAFEHLWSRGFGDDWPQAATRVALSPAGDVIFTGDFMGCIDLGGGPLTSAGSMTSSSRLQPPGSAPLEQALRKRQQRQGPGPGRGRRRRHRPGRGLLLRPRFRRGSCRARATRMPSWLASTRMASISGARASAASYDAAYAVACDGSGDVILAGQFRGNSIWAAVLERRRRASAVLRAARRLRRASVEPLLRRVRGGMEPERRSAV